MESRGEADGSVHAGDSNLREKKRQLSPILLAIPGVSGIGIPGGVMTVYLQEDSESVRRQVADVVSRNTPDIPVRYVVTGAFRAQ